MGKRKVLEKVQHDADEFDESPSEDSSNEDDNDEMVDLDFEWFDPQPEHDYHGLKTLLRQLLDDDSQMFELGALADLILSQPLLGSTVKVDGNETDPYAFLTVLNLQEHKEDPSIQRLVKYLIGRAATNPVLSPLEHLLIPSDTVQIGLILTERLLNIPEAVVPPMYKMLVEEISWALEEKEPYNFTHYLVLSKTYQVDEPHLDQETGSTRKKKKQKSGTNNKTAPSLFYFHPEDEIIQRHAKLFGGFEYATKQGEGQAGWKKTLQELGIKAQGHLILIEAEKFGRLVEALA